MKLSELRKRIEDTITEILSEGENKDIVWNSSNRNDAKIEVDRSRLSSDAKKETKAQIDQNPSGIITNVPTTESDEDEFDAPEKEPSKSELKKIDKEEKKYSKDITSKFNTLKGSVEKHKGDQAKAKALINQIGKEKYKLPKKLLDDLKRIANISTKD